MINSMTLKAFIRKKSSEWKVPAQIVLQYFFFERFLVRLDKSPYRPMFVLKGGFLISSLAGIAARTTMDLDMTIRGFSLDVGTLGPILGEIVQIVAEDGIEFRFVSSEEIRETDEYPGIRAKLEGTFGSIRVSFKLDLTTGDAMTPGPILFSHPMLSEEKSIQLFSYNLETVLAEKMETILSRNVLNTRPRDFYDVFLLGRLFWSQIDFGRLREALDATSWKRGSREMLKDYPKIMESIGKDEHQNSYWEKFRSQFPFAGDLSFHDVHRSVNEMLERVFDIDAE